MSFFYPLAKKPTCPADIRSEGRLRETLAAYFLTAAPAEKQSVKEQKQYRCALQKLAELEIQALLQSCKINRPLRYGDLIGLLSAVLQTSNHLLQKKGIRIQCKIPDTPLCTAAEPRLVTMSVIRLLRAFIASNPKDIIKFSVTIREQSVFCIRFIKKVS